MDPVKTEAFRTMVLTLLPAASLTLAGCWTPPNANVQPKGRPGLIQDGVVVESVKDAATVLAIDAGTRSISLKLSNHNTLTCKVGAKVEILGHIQVGDQVKATVSEELAVYVLENGRLPDGTTAETLGINAKVLLVDPSYRILTLQYPDGQIEALKPGLGTRMEQMSPGDSVVVRPREVTSVKIEKP